MRFVPRMIAQDEPGHVVNTASIAGLTSGAGLPYTGFEARRRADL